MLKQLKGKSVVLGLIALDVLLFALGKAITLAVLLALGLMFYGIKAGIRALFRKSILIWRLRYRLIVTYVFIGGVPILLILALSYLGAWIVVGQVATYLVSSELSRRAGVLEAPAKLLADAKPSARLPIAIGVSPVLHDRAPGAEILVTGDGPDLHFPETSKLTALPPGWNNYTGLVLSEGRYFLMSLVKKGNVQALVVAPLDRPVMEKLVEGLGTLNIYNIGAARVVKGGNGGLRLQASQTDPDPNPAPTFAGKIPPAYNILDREFPWGNPIDIVEWSKPNEKYSALLSVTTRTSAVLATVFGDRVDFAQGILVAFLAIVALLALVELISVIIGISMTRTITGAVHNLYEGTLRIGKGDFSTKVPVKGSDQLADLSTSFNQMTEQLSGLVEVAKEKERLQSEVSIATEVQARLFPHSAPIMQTIQLLGTCEPARSVSGDYYDYLRLPSGNLALAIGDVAGKGISAALLMASIQSIMRTQLVAGLIKSGAVDGYVSTAGIVEQLSKQLYANTSPEKYATFFFGVYDDTSRILRYTNAGHLSPLLVSSGNITPLEVTGTVVGMFPSMTYEERQIGIGANDLLIAYTDGISEPENAYGEEFGVERLADVVMKYQACELEEMVAKVREAVTHWSNTPELPDDMTVLIARGLA